MAVTFYQLEPISLKNRNLLKTFIELLFKKEKKKLQSLDIIFCSDEYLLQINQTHLKHDYYTDIITFDLSSTKISPITGELYISIDRVRDNAKQNKVSLTEELHRVMFHGTLHLCGYKDKKSSDILKMREMETLYLSKYFK